MKPLIICGGPGTGKTELANKIAEMFPVGSVYRVTGKIDQDNLNRCALVIFDGIVNSAAEIKSRYTSMLENGLTAACIFVTNAPIPQDEGRRFNLHCTSPEMITQNTVDEDCICGTSNYHVCDWNGRCERRKTANTPPPFKIAVG